MSIKDTSFYITILVFFLPSSATLRKKVFKLVKNPFFLHFESRQFMTLTFIHQFYNQFISKFNSSDVALYIGFLEDLCKSVHNNS